MSTWVIWHIFSFSIKWETFSRGKLEVFNIYNIFYQLSSFPLFSYPHTLHCSEAKKMKIDKNYLTRHFNSILEQELKFSFLALITFVWEVAPWCLRHVANNFLTLILIHLLSDDETFFMLVCCHEWKSYDHIMWESNCCKFNCVRQTKLEQILVIFNILYRRQKYIENKYKVHPSTYFILQDIEIFLNFN